MKRNEPCLLPLFSGAPAWRPRVLVFAVASVFCGPPNALAQTLPINPTVVNGAAGFQPSGNQLTVTNTPGTIINWQSFSIGSGATTQFVQQNAVSSVFNRVTGGDPSQIAGNLISNGRVFLINPSGITIGAGARIDTAAFVASSLGISNVDLLAGKFRFDATPGTGNVINQGTIVTQNGGFVYFIGRNVENSGVIHTPKGEIILAAGNSVEIINPQSPNLRVEISATQNEAINLGKLVASGGTIGMFAGNVRQRGVASASTAEVNAQGRIVFRAKKDVEVASGSRTEANGPTGGSVTIQAESGTATVAGLVEARGGQSLAGEGALPGAATVVTAVNVISVIDAPGSGQRAGSALAVTVKATPVNLPVAAADAAAPATSVQAVQDGKGGNVVILGDVVALIGDARVDVSGEQGGGSLLVGGDYMGHNAAVQNARFTSVDAGVILKANADLAGGGGKVVVWADVSTSFRGGIVAQGGVQGGNGGFVETSGKGVLYFRGQVDTRARREGFSDGTLLLDPTNIYIAETLANVQVVAPGVTSDNVETSLPPNFAGFGAIDDSYLLTGTLTTALATNNVTVTTANGSAGGLGNITIIDPIVWATARRLTLTANNNIVVNAAISNSAAGGLTLTALGSGAITGNASGSIGVAGASVAITSGTGGVNLGAAINSGSGTISVNGGGGAVVTGALVSTNATASAVQVSAATTLSIGATQVGNNGGVVTLSHSGAGSQTGVLSGVGGVGSGARVVKQGIGNLALSLANTYAGGTTISAGSVGASNAAALGTGKVTVDAGALNLSGTISIANAIDLAASTTLASTAGTNTVGGSVAFTGNSTKVNVATGATLLLNSALTESAGNRSLDKDGAGTLILAADSSYGGNTSITNGTLQVGNGGATGTVAGNTTITAGTLVFNRSAALVYAGNISGAGAVTQAGTGDITLSGTNSYSGGTNVTAARLVSGKNNAYGSGAITVNGGALALGAFDQTAGNVSLQVGSITGTGTLTGSAYDVRIGSISANLAGDATVQLTKSTGTSVTLSGANTYAGATTVSGGTLILGNAAALGSTTGVSVASGATLDIGGQAVGAGAGVTLAGGTLANSIGSGSFGGAIALSANSTISVGGTQLTLAGVISEDASPRSVTKTGAGVVVLSASNTFSGDLTISAGTVSAGTAANLGSGNLVFNGGALLATSGFATAKTVTLAAAGNINTGANTVTLSGKISGNGGVLGKGGSGTLVIGNAANDYDQGTQVSAGTLRAGVATAFGSGSLTLSAGTTVDINGLAVANNMSLAGATLTDSVGDGSVGGTVALTAAGNLFSTIATKALTLNGVISGGVGNTLAIGGAGTVVYAKDNTYTGQTSISTGATLQIGAGGATGAVAGVLDNAGTLAFNRSGTFNVAGLSGAGAVAQNGSGILALGGDNSGFIGAFTVNDGTLQLTSANALGATSGVTVAGGRTLDLNGQTVLGTPSLLLNGGRLLNSSASTDALFGGAITLGATSTLEVTTAARSMALGGAIGGSAGAGLLKAGAGTVVLGVANAYSGLTDVQAGTLAVTANNALGTTAAGTSVALGAAIDLRGSNYTSAEALTLNGGSALLASTGTSSFGGQITLGATSTIDVAGSRLTLSNAIGDGGSGFGLLKAGAGVLELGGVNTYGGATTINGGIVSIDADARLGAAPVAATPGNLNLSGGTLAVTGSFALNANRGIALGAGGGTIDVAASQTLDYAGVITGANALSKSGAGTLVLGGANLFSGEFAINGGTVSAADAGNLGAGSLAFNAGTLLATATITTAKALALNGAATIDTNANAVILGGIVSGVGSLGKIGAGMLSLNGANSYSGATTVSAGTLALGTATALGTSAGGTTVGSGAILDLNGQAVGAETLALNGGTLANSTASASLAGTVSFSGASTVSVAGTQLTLSGANGGTGSMDKTGSGTLILAGANAQTGGTTISAGVLQVGAGGAAGSLAGDVTNNATLSFDRSDALTHAGVISGSGTVSQAGGGVLTLSGANTFSGAANVASATLRLGNATALGTNAGTTTVAAGATLDLDGQAVGTESLVLSGGTLANNGASNASLAGPVSLAAPGSTLASVGGRSLLITGLVSGANGVNIGGAGIVVLAADNTYSGSTSIATGSTLQVGNGATAGAIAGAISNSGTLAFNRSDSVTYSADLGGTGGVTQAGSGILILSGNNTFTGATLVSSGTLRVGSATALGSVLAGTTVAAAAMLDINGQTVGAEAVTLAGGIIANSTGSGALSGAIGLTGNSAVNVTGTALALSGGIGGGAFGITKSGAGVLVLSGGNTYTGVTSVNAGVLQAGALNGLAAGSAHDVASGATLDLNGNNASVASIGGAGGVSLGSATLTSAGSGSTTFSGLVTGTAASGLVKLGSGTLLLSGNNTGLDGAVNVGAGTLSLGNAGALGSLVGGTTVASGATLDVNGQAVGAEALALNGGTLANGAGSGSLAGVVTFTGASTVNVAGTQLTLSGANGGTGSVDKTGSGVLILSGANSQSGGTTLSQGVLQVGAGGTSGSLAGTITNNAILTFNRSDALAHGGAIGGTGVVNQSGLGVLTLSGANSHTGSTNVTSGTLVLGSATALGTTAGGTTVATGAILDLNGQAVGAEALALDGATLANGAGSGSLAGGVTFTGANIVNVAGTQLTLSGANGGAGSVDKTGSGTLILSGANSQSGGTSISQGVLQVGAGGTSGSLAGSITNNATLTFNRSDALGHGGAIGGTGVVNQSGLGMLTLSGANTYSGATNANSGTLALGSATALGTTAGGTTVASGATLDLNGQAVAAEALALNGATLANGAGSGSLAGVVTFTATSTVNVAGTQLTLSGANGGTGSVDKTGSGALILSGANSQSGGTTISQGVLQVGAGGTTGSLAGSITNNATLTFNRSDALAHSGAIGGTGVVNQSGLGILTLSGSNTYSGATNANSGTLALGSANALGTTVGGTVVASGATLDIKGQALGIEAVTLNGATLSNSAGSGSLSGAVTLASATSIDVAAGQLVLSGPVGGTGSMSKEGTANLRLAGNNTFSGSVTVNAGTLQVAANSALGTATNGTTVNSGATLELDSTAMTGIGTEALVLNSGASAATLKVSGGGAVAIGSGIVLSGGGAAAAQIMLSGNGSSLNLGNNTINGSASGVERLVVTGAGSSVLTIGDIGAGVALGGLSVQAGTIALTGSTYRSAGMTSLTGNVVNNGGAALDLAFDDLDISGALNAGGQALTLHPLLSSRSIALGGASGGAFLGLSAADLNALANVSTLTIGGAPQTGAINVVGNVSAAASGAGTVNLTNQTGGIDFSANLSIKSGALLNVMANAGGNPGAITAAGGGTIFAGQLSLQAQGGIGVLAAPVKLGNSAVLTAANSGAGGIFVQANSAGGQVDLTVAAAGVSNAGSGAIVLQAANNLTIDGKVSSGNGNVTLQAGTGAGNADFLLPSASGPAGALGNVQINSVALAGPAIDSGTGNILIQSTGSVTQLDAGNSGLRTTGTGSLTVQTFNDVGGLSPDRNTRAQIKLENNNAAAGNSVGGNITLEAMLASKNPNRTTGDDYGNGNISFKSGANLVLKGVGTAGDIQLTAAGHDILSTASLQGNNVVIIADGSSAGPGNGNIVVGIGIPNSVIKNGKAGGSLQLRAVRDITLNETIGDGNASRFNHALTLVAGNDINVNRSIWLDGNLSLQSNAPSAVIGAGVAMPSTGSVNLVNASTTQVLEVRAKTIAIGDAVNPVKAVKISATGSAGANAKLGVSLESDGNLGMSVLGGVEIKAGTANGQNADAAVNIKGSSVVIESGGSLVITAGTASGAKADASVNLTAPALQLKIGSLAAGGDMKIFAGTASGGGTANALVDASTAKSFVVGGDLIIQGGSADSASAAIARVDPAGPMTISTGRGLALIAGTSPTNSSASITNTGIINLLVNQNGLPAANKTDLTSAGLGLVASNLILVGNSNSGVYNIDANDLLNKLPKPVAPNALPLGYLAAPITLGGGALVTYIDAGRNEAFILSGVDSLFNPAQPDTPVGIARTIINLQDPNKNKNRSDDACP